MYAQYYENGYNRHHFQETMASRPAMTIEEFMRRKISEFRHWKKTNLFKRRTNWKFQFSVMTYNILSQTALDHHRYLYRNCNPMFTSESYRVAMVIPEILHSRSDIVCLQEVEEYVYEARMRHVLERQGFGSIFKKRTGNKTDGCAIFWRLAKFEFVGQRDIEFRTKSTPLLDRDNIGLIAVLRPNHQNAGNVLLHVATTHLLYNPKRGDVKLCQLRWLLAELDRMALIGSGNNERHYHPVIFCGDLNIQAHSPLYDFIETGYIDVANTTAGDLSGQLNNKNSGKAIQYEKLLLDAIGISSASLFEEEPHDEQKKFRGGPISFQSGPSQSGPSSNSVVVNEDATNSGIFSFLNKINALPDNSSSTNSANGSIGSESKKCVENAPHSYPVITIEDSLDSGTFPTLNKKDLASDTLIALNSGNGSEESESRECFTHGFKFVPVYKFHNIAENSLPVTCMTGNECHTVDHIFYNVESKSDRHSFREGILRLLSWYTLLTKEELEEIGGLPNAGLGSDHICLVAHFGLCL